MTPIDPVLKGTTFAAALEGAARDEQMKREQRATETAGLKPQARLFAQALRGYTAPVTTTQTVPSNDQLMADKRALWAQQAHAAAQHAEAELTHIRNTQDIQEMFHMTEATDTPKITTMRDLLELLSDDAWQKPPQGIEQALRKLAFANGWLEATGQTSARQWHITNEGFEELARLRTGAPASSDQAFEVLDGVINLGDPALHAAPSETVDALNQTIKRLQFELHIFHKVEAALTPMMDEDGQGPDLLAYVMWLRARSVDQTQTSTTGIVADWYTTVVTPLVEFIVEDNPQTTADYLLSHPQMIANYITVIMAQALRDAIALADERAQTIEQKDSKIESLNRCIEELRENLQARLIAPGRAVADLLAVEILDELCDQLPEVEAYRVARESAVKAISTLKARRS